ncbi:hexokinase type 2-like [Teleopsis dalmanni]|uniref:hexokinase type 2-like n=1 Tax=Teleopsis dalmanni TaxID=139649 RepID=UPI0018CCE499|nr:hexokinase type 2-like [Teleopsis dalmanni]XP_037945288.1 hexokinase type 2-like [Teleopsis dalmanni]
MTDLKIREFTSSMSLTFPQVHEIYKRFCNQIRSGLGKHSHATADTKCYVTFVQDLPTGQEVGNYLALDLGGSNFRVLLVTLKGNYDSEQVSVTYPIHSDLMIGTAEELFDYIASCLENFVKLHNIEDDKLYLGFTFSFPCTQINLTQAILRRWTKGFQVAGVVDEDISVLLKDAIDRRGTLNIEPVAIVNDTVGTLISCAYFNNQCRIGLIVGTGCNACYLEHVKCIERMDAQYREKKNMIINTEWGAFGEGGDLEFIRTDYDKQVDDTSPNPKEQIFEKMVAGMYLGKLVGYMTVRAINESYILVENEEKHKIVDVLEKDPDVFETYRISQIECDLSTELKSIQTIMRELFEVTFISHDDCLNFKHICESVTRRSATLVAVNISALINKINEPRVVVAVDGSLFRLHPRYDSYMRETLRKFVNPKIVYDLVLSEDGSGRGAALIAAVATMGREEEVPEVPEDEALLLPIDEANAEEVNVSSKSPSRAGSKSGSKAGSKSGSKAGSKASSKATSKEPSKENLNVNK